LEATQTNGFLRAGRADPIAAPANDPIVSDPKNGNKIRKTRRTRDAILTHDFAHGSRSFCLSRARSLFCFATAPENYPIPGGIKSRRLRRGGFHVCRAGYEALGDSAPADVSATASRSRRRHGRVVASAAGKAGVIAGTTGARRSPARGDVPPDVFTAVAGLSVRRRLRGRGRPLDHLRESGITNFYWHIFRRRRRGGRVRADVNLTMRTLLGRGFSDPAGSLSSKTARDFSASPTPIGPLRAGSAKGDLSYFSEIYRKIWFRGGLNWYATSTATGNSPALAGGKSINRHCSLPDSKRFRHYGLMGAKRVADMNGCCRT